MSKIKGHVDLTVLTGYLDVSLYTLRVANLSYTSHESTDRSTYSFLVAYICIDMTVQYKRVTIVRQFDSVGFSLLHFF